MNDQQEVARRFVQATALRGVEPVFDDVAFGHPYPMDIEAPLYHRGLRESRETVGVAPCWFIKGLANAWVITRYDDVKRAFVDTEAFQPRATQEITTFPLMGGQMLGMRGREHTGFRRVVLPAFAKRRVPAYEDALLRRHAGSLIDGNAPHGRTPQKGFRGKNTTLRHRGAPPRAPGAPRRAASRAGTMIAPSIDADSAGGVRCERLQYCSSP